jgi:transposase
LPAVDGNGYIIGLIRLLAGNHHDSYDLKETIRRLFHDLKRLGLDCKGALLNADSSFDTREARKMLWNREVRPNIAENKRNRKTVKRGRKRHFDAEIYKHRFIIERTFAWIDKFKELLIRFTRKDIYFLGFHYIAFTMINLRNVLPKV